MSITLEPKQSLEILKVIAEKNERIKQLEDGIRRIEKWVISKSNNYDKHMAIEQECEFLLKALEEK